jgi:prepilin-type processing-associated H-X9-DG protein
MNSYLELHLGLWGRQGQVIGYTNASQIKFPSELFVILDERAESINDGTFASDPDTLFQLVDFPGAYHNGSGSFSFADGHVELHRWTDPRTNPVPPPGQPFPLNVNLPGDLDIVWLQQHAVGQRSWP